MGPPGYFWRVGPIRDTIEDLGLQIMRMRCGHYGLKFDRSGRLPGGSYLRVATTYACIPANPWECACLVVGNHARQAEHEYVWYGQGAQRAEWRTKRLLS
eukprot:4538879-Pyramimonas_sp.AAC.1